MNESGSAPSQDEQEPDRNGAQQTRENARKRIAQFQARFNRMLVAMAAFILLSMFAGDDFSVLPPLPETIRDVLGSPPSANMINTALIVYSFSAILLILSRMMGGSGSYGGMAHVGYLAAFYGFYHFSGTLQENFWAVFAAGTTILCLETYHVWIYCMEHIRKEQERLGAGNEGEIGRGKE